ncbi:MAG: hypothetical protein HOC74_01980 [Gemmatimonadetes bacterium]|nr:hypothetical protein [Gemmatimonadota bacterium]
MKLLQASRLALVILVGLSANRVLGERISFATRSAWQEWTMPTGAVEVTPAGDVQLVPVRKNIDAVVNAANFGGGIRAVGSNPGDADLLMDGDPTTGWAPLESDGEEKWWVEIDLGRLVTAEKVRILFTDDAPPLEFVNVLLSNGEKFFTNALVPIENSLVFNYSQRFGFNQEQVLIPNFSHASLRIIRIEISQRLSGGKVAEVEVESIGDNVALGLLERGGNIDLITELQEVLAGAERMVDGDAVTDWRMQVFHQTHTGAEILNQLIFDLGAHYWLDQIRIVGEPASTPPQNRSRYANFFWYKILASDGSLAPDGSLRWQELAFVPADPHNLFDVRNFDHAFPLQKVRYIQHFFSSSVASGTDRGTHGSIRNFAVTSEYQMYGEGFPAEVEMISPILVLNDVKNLTSIEWDADSPVDTRLEVSSRTGNNVVEETHYFDKKGKEITKRKWEKTPSSLRGPTEASISIGDDWSPWSEPYTFSGELFASPSPRKYVQLKVLLLSDDPRVASTLSALHLNMENPIALQMLGEVYPAQVQPGREEEFTYFILPTFGGRSQGFDRLTLNASVPVEFIDLRIGDEPIQAEILSLDGGFVLDLPREIRTPELVELTFQSTIFQNQTRFDAFLGNSRLGDDVRQRVDAGDASETVDSESIAVRLPVTGDLLGNVVLAPQVLTPNGDGVGDELRLEFDALKLVSPRPIRVMVFDLAGRMVRDLSGGEGVAQHYDFTWNGRDRADKLVAPGTYLVQIEIEGDSQTQTIHRLLPVAY